MSRKLSASIPLLLFLLCFFLVDGLNEDGVLLLSFKDSVTSDPLAVLGDWNTGDATPCDWNGVTCVGFPAMSPATKSLRVVSLVLQRSQLVSSITCDLGLIEHLTVLDLSVNFINGSLPAEFGRPTLRYLNLSFNRISGEIPANFGAEISMNATLDFSFNNLSGEIPDSDVFRSQKTQSFAGNTGLCGKIFNDPCPIRSSEAFNDSSAAPQTKNKTPAIAAIVAGNFFFFAIIVAIILFIYKTKKKKKKTEEERSSGPKDVSPSPSRKPLCSVLRVCCGRKLAGDLEETESTTSHGDGEDSKEETATDTPATVELNGREEKDSLVMVDGETEMDKDTLLRASAFMLGTSRSGIVYKAVLADGGEFAVRRIGDDVGDFGGQMLMKDFEARVRSIAKLHHPNVLRLRGFYWGADEKLLIHDYAANGSLANVLLNSKHFRQSTAKSDLHEKKTTHGNIKPSNILLNSDMAPVIADLGMHWLNSGEGRSSSSRFGNRKSTMSQSSFPDLSSPELIIAGESPKSNVMSYKAPESLKSHKSNPKWDVFSFGVVLLEIVAGRVITEAEIAEWSTGFVAEENIQVLRMADPALREEMGENEEPLLACFKLGFACASSAPQRRPSMKEAVQILEKLPSSS